MIELPRRQFITGLVSLMAAPAIVRAGSLMPVSSVSFTTTSNGLLTIREITYEAVKLFKNSNAFIKHINEQYEKDFLLSDTLKVHLPNNFGI